MLTDPQWYFSSQPALGRRIPSLFGPAVFDLNRATTLAWQSNGIDADGHAVRYRIDQIDDKATLSGTGIAGPETLLWLTLYPLSVGGQLDITSNPAGSFRWTVQNQPPGRRWRSIRTVLSPGGADISHAENLEFWAQIPDDNPLNRGRNPPVPGSYSTGKVGDIVPILPAREVPRQPVEAVDNQCVAVPNETQRRL